MAGDHRLSRTAAAWFHDGEARAVSFLLGVEGLGRDEVALDRKGREGGRLVGPTGRRVSEPMIRTRSDLHKICWGCKLSLAPTEDP